MFIAVCGLTEDFTAVTLKSTGYIIDHVSFHVFILLVLFRGRLRLCRMENDMKIG